MNKPFAKQLIFVFCILLPGHSALAGSNAEQTQSRAPVSVETDKSSAWDKTRQAGSGMIESGQKIGSATAQKSREFYLAAKENGSAAGDAIADGSRHAWEKTKQAGNWVAEKATAIGHGIAEKSKSLYRQATHSSEPNRREDI